MTSEVFLYKHHLLKFGGLDTIAVVTFNDVVIGNASNMFRRYVFDVTDLLKVLRAGSDYVASHLCCFCRLAWLFCGSNWDDNQSSFARSCLLANLFL